MAQFSRYFRPGDHIVVSSSDNEDVEIVSSVSAKTGKVSTVVINNSEAPVTMKINGLGNAAKAYVTDSENGFERIDDLDESDLSAYTFGAQSITLLAERDPYTVTKKVGSVTKEEAMTAADFTLWPAPDVLDGQFVGWTDGSALYRAGDTYTLTGNTDFEAVVLDIYMTEGASVRLNAQNSGIRFTTNIGRDGYDFLEEVAKNLTVGTLIVPTDYIPDGKLSLETPKVVNVPNGSGDSVGWMNITMKTYSYGGSLVNLLPNNYIRNFSGIGYVTVEYADGSSTTFYAPYDTAYARSILTVACRAYDDVEKGYADWQKKIIKAYIDGVVRIDTADCSVIAPDSSEYEVNYSSGYHDGVLTVFAVDGKEWDARAVKSLVVDGKINKEWSVVDNTIQLVFVNIGGSDDFGDDIFDDKWVVQPDSETATAIHANQIGYLTNEVKRAVVIGGGRTFDVVNANTGDVVYSGLVEKGSKGVDKFSGDVVCYADFTDFTEEGRYYLSANGVTSYPFNIGNDTLDAVGNACLKAFYYQRCGYDLDEEYAGDIARTACHAYGSDYFPIDGTSRNVQGGWHDAGDCGCYTTVVALSTQLMLLQYQLMPDVIGDDTDIPEAGNGVSDLLDEVRVGLDWLFQMQDIDGGVYHSRGNNGPVALGLIENDVAMYYIWPKTVEATCGFVATMADAYKVFKDIDADYANRCKNAALACENWLLTYWDDDNMTSNIHLDGSRWYQDADGKGTFAYMDNNSRIEEHMAASFAFYELTGDSAWHDRFVEAAELKSDISKLDYNDYAFLTAYKYLKSDLEKDNNTVRTLERRIDAIEADIIGQFRSMPYRIANSGDNFGWGSNAELTGKLISLILIDDYNGKQGEHKDVIIESLDYILGKNAVGYCFITGHGSNQVLYMHHRATYQTNKIIPGYMVSGPVKYAHAYVSHNDLDQYGITADTPNMKCFYDKWEFYRFTESDTARITQSTFVISYVRDLAK